jgi:hypothetical protein
VVHSSYGMFVSHDSEFEIIRAELRRQSTLVNDVGECVVMFIIP